MINPSCKLTFMINKDDNTEALPCHCQMCCGDLKLDLVARKPGSAVCKSEHLHLIVPVFKSLPPGFWHPSKSCWLSCPLIISCVLQPLRCRSILLSSDVCPRACSLLSTRYGRSITPSRGLLKLWHKASSACAVSCCYSDIYTSR